MNTEPTLNDFAEFLDNERNKDIGDLWNDMSIWQKDTAFRIMLSKFMERYKGKRNMPQSEEEWKEAVNEQWREGPNKHLP